MSDDVAVVGGSEARADAEQGVEGRCGVAAAVPAEHALVEELVVAFDEADYAVRTPWKVLKRPAKLQARRNRDDAILDQSSRCPKRRESSRLPRANDRYWQEVRKASGDCQDGPTCADAIGDLPARPIAFSHFCGNGPDMKTDAHMEGPIGLHSRDATWHSQRCDGISAMCRAMGPLGPHVQLPEPSIRRYHVVVFAQTDTRYRGAYQSVFQTRSSSTACRTPFARATDGARGALYEPKSPSTTAITAASRATPGDAARRSTVFPIGWSRFERLSNHGLQVQAADRCTIVPPVTRQGDRFTRIMPKHWARSRPGDASVPWRLVMAAVS